MTLKGKRILLGLTGGIAAYKAAELARLFMKAGCDVRAVLTPAAERFIGAATLVRENVPAHALVVGVPGRLIGWVGEHGEKLVFEGDLGACPVTGQRFRIAPGGSALVPER